MKILYLITGLRLGGAEKQLLLLAKNMQLTGNEVLVAVMEPNGAMLGDFNTNGINVRELNVKGMSALPMAYSKFKEVVKEFAPDVIHSHMIHANLFASFFKLLNSRYRLVCTAHNMREGNEVIMAGYHFIKRIANWTTNVSLEAYTYFIQKKYFDPKKSSCIPNAIDTAVFDPAKFQKSQIRTQFNVPANVYVFFSAGRLHHQKNHELLLRAFAFKTIPDSLLYIAGEGPELSKLKTLTVELNINKKVVFLGARDDIPALMSMSDCFVLSSDFEGFGLVIAEAMAMQLPVVSTDCGGVKEVMGGLGSLVKTGDVAGLNKAMETASQTKPHENDASRRHIESSYGIPVILSKWQQLYNSL